MGTQAEFQAEVAEDLRRDIAAAKAKHSPEVIDHVIDLNNAFPMPVAIEIDFDPGERGAWDTPPTPPYLSITSIKSQGVEILQALPKDFVEALESDFLDEHRRAA